MTKTVIIGIAGGSGSGKTTFAEQLRQKLEPQAVVLAHDDYYKHLPDMTAQQAISYDFDCPEALDTHLLIGHLRALKDGESVEVPSYDFTTYARTEAARRVEPAPFVIVEGLLILCDPELRSLFDLTVYLDVDADVRALRRIRRDCEERGADLERAINMYFNAAKPAHLKYVEPYKDEADIVISDTSSNALEAVIDAIRMSIS